MPDFVLLVTFLRLSQLLTLSALLVLGHSFSPTLELSRVRWDGQLCIWVLLEAWFDVLG